MPKAIGDAAGLQNLIQACREACGGAGYLAENRLAGLKADTDVFTTFEGDNTILLQLVAKSLLTGFRDEFGELNPIETAGFVASQVWETVVERTAAREIIQRLTDDLVKLIQGDLCVDTTRVFALGFSYGGGMSSAKSALEGDTRTLAYEAGRRWGIRVNTISAGPLASRAAKAIGTIGLMVDYYRAHSPLAEANSADDVGRTAAFLCSPLAAGITGETLHVDKGYHAMGMFGDDLLGENVERRERRVGRRHDRWESRGGRGPERR